MRIVALGAGRMGRGIAHVFAYAGYRVDVLDFKPRPAAEGARLREAALAEIGANLALLRDLGVLDEAQRRVILGRVRVLPLDEAPAALAAADVVFEGVTETLDAKRDAFARACAHLRPEAILASTTSSLDADELAAFVVAARAVHQRALPQPGLPDPAGRGEPGEGDRGRDVRRHEGAARVGRQGRGALRAFAGLHRAAPAGRGDERGGAPGRRGRRDARGHRPGGARRLRSALYGDGHVRVHRLRRARHPVLRLELGDGARRSARRATSRPTSCGR